MNRYTPQNPPRRGNARKIWNAITAAGFTIAELHYNPNLWGRAGERGWGTWGVSFPRDQVGYWCGIDSRGVYMEGLTAPYNRTYITAKKE